MMQTRSVFVHVPKCGGKSVIRQVYGLGEHEWFGHAPVASYLALLGPSRFGRFFKFTIVREPVSRCLSGYRFYAAGGFGLDRDLDIQARLAGRSFDAFVEDGLEQAIATDVVFRPQSRFVFLPCGALGVDRICAFEAFDAALAALPERLAQPRPIARHNVSPGAAPGVAAATAQRVRQLYAQDYRRFGALGAAAPVWATQGLAETPATV